MTMLCRECSAPATWHADHCEAGRAYYCGKCVAVPNRDGELTQLRRMPVCRLCEGSGWQQVVPGQIHACDCKRFGHA